MIRVNASVAGEKQKFSADLFEPTVKLKAPVWAPTAGLKPRIRKTHDLQI